MERKRIEIIAPCYNEEQCIELFCRRIEDVFSRIEGYDFSILFVDDGSEDATLQIIKNMAENMYRGKVRYLSFSRNFGKESAMAAGLENSDGDLIAVMDVDLQHPPELLYEMIEAVETEGYDCCAARRVTRDGEGVIRSFLSRSFYHVINMLTEIDLIPGGTDYRLMKKEVAEAIVSLPERERFTKGIYSWIGFKTKWISYHNVERAAGQSKWSVRHLFGYAGSGIIAFATAPLRGVIYLGVIVTAIAVAYAGNVIWGEIHTGGGVISGLVSPQ